jgi:undecaprenyl-diphosphatase
MSLPDTIVLGILQGLTEFLPVSSSGHLVVLQYLLGLGQPMLAYDVLLHIGTLIAVVAYFRREVAGMAVSLVAPARFPAGRRLVFMIVAASVPTAIIGLSFESLVETTFQTPAAVALFWVLTAGLLFGVSRISGSGKGIEEITLTDALLIGLFQGVAVLPGVSRSGATIVMGMICGLRPKDAAAFSFLLSIPAILGAVVLQAKDLRGVGGAESGLYVTGAVIAAVTGYVAIWILLKLLQKRVIRPFAWYCLAAAVVTLIALKVAP